MNDQVYVNEEYIPYMKNPNKKNIGMNKLIYDIFDYPDYGQEYKKSYIINDPSDIETKN